MRFSYQWLKEYIDINLSGEKLAELLTMLGIEVENYQAAPDGDLIFELELTSNRPDCANMTGIAREIGARLKKRVKYPSFKINQGQAKIQDFLKVQVQETRLCPRYTARFIRNIKVGSSPAWLKLRLEKMGLRSINNIVDATNFVMMELGHPLHAFDADTLAKKGLIIRRAKKGEKITTIDLVERELETDILVIADGEKPQAIAGIMGGNLSEVTSSTKNVAVESAYFDKSSIRRSGKKLGLMTEASYRFERGTDPKGLIPALNRASALITELAGGEICQGIIDIYKKKIPPRAIGLNLETVNGLLGTELTLAQIKGILKGLEFKIKKSTRNKIDVLVPSFRGDIEREVDLVEEVARHYGFDKIEGSLPRAAFSPYPKRLEDEAKKVSFDALLKFGLQEAVNFSFVSLDSLSALNLDEKVFGKKFVRIKNPISQGQDIMRPTLLASLLNNTVWNFNRQLEEVKIFEIAKVFFSATLDVPEEKDENKKGIDTGFIEKTAIAFVLAEAYSKPSGIRNSALDLFSLKGMIEALLNTLGISSFKEIKGGLPSFHPNNSARLIKNGKKIGSWGEVSPEVSEKLGLKGKIFAAEIILDEILPWVDLTKHFRKLPKFPAITRDLSLLVPIEATSDEITSQIWKEGGDLIKKIDLFDVYQGKQIPGGFRSLGYRLTYRSLVKTLTDDEVNEVHSKISTLLENNLKVKIRGG